MGSGIFWFLDLVHRCAPFLMRNYEFVGLKMGLNLDTKKGGVEAVFL